MVNKVPPRNVPARDDFYMGMAFWAASKSKDPHTQVGAFVIDTENSPLGWGYNGPPRCIQDNLINWDRPYKYDFICHAEENAIDYARGQLKDATIYVTAKPCVRCALKIVKHELARIVYYPMSKKSDSSSSLANEEIHKKTEEITQLGGVGLEEFFGNLNWMRDRMKWMELMGVFD